MHTGQFVTLRSVIDFFGRGGHPGGYPGVNELTPINLSERERNDLVALIEALQGDGPAALLLTSP